VLAVFNAARFDFGADFLRSIPTEREQNAWKHRLRHVVEGCEPGDLIDGYERAKRERAPYAPTLANIEAATKAINATPLPQAKQWERLPPPKQNPSIAEAALEAMRQRVITPTVRAKIKPAPGGSELPCDACGKTITANEAMPRLVGQKILAVCWECYQA
jgi:hypothetical protein